MGKSGSLIFLYLCDDPDLSQNIMGMTLDQDQSSHFFHFSWFFIIKQIKTQPEKWTDKQTVINLISPWQK